MVCVRTRSALCCDVVSSSGTDAERLCVRDAVVQAVVKVCEDSHRIPCGEGLRYRSTNWFAL
jgi:hypothetical protein